MREIFAYIIGLGAAVMMPVIFTILGLLAGTGFAKALKSGLLVGVGFIGLGAVTGLLTHGAGSLGAALGEMARIYSLDLGVFDLGWPAAAAVAYSTAVGAFTIPVCLGVNVLMLAAGCTRTVNIDLWNYWHFAFLGGIVYYATSSLGWAFFAAVDLYIITLCMADFTARGFQKYYAGMEGISLPHPFCQSFTLFALALCRLMDHIPALGRLDIDAEGLKKRFGLLGEPLFLGVATGTLIGALASPDWKSLGARVPQILALGVTLGAVMELIPRITALFIEGLKPISLAVREKVEKRFSSLKGLSIGMSPALVIGHPATLVVSILLIPVILVLAAFLPGNKFLPLASLAGMFYLFPCVLPLTKGNVPKTFAVGLISLVAGLYFATDLAPAFTKAVVATGEGAYQVPQGMEGVAALDFASGFWCWALYHLSVSFKWVGAAAATLLALAMCAINFVRIRRL